VQGQAVLEQQTPDPGATGFDPWLPTNLAINQPRVRGIGDP
jgi:hypothetical protein